MDGDAARRGNIHSFGIKGHVLVPGAHIRNLRSTPFGVGYVTRHGGPPDNRRETAVTICGTTTRWSVPPASMSASSPGRVFRSEFE